MDRVTGIDGCGCSAANGKAENVAFPIEKKVRSVVCPVGRFEVTGIGVDYAAIRGRDRHRLESAVKHRWGRTGGWSREIDVREYRLLDHILIMGANANT